MIGVEDFIKFWVTLEDGHKLTYTETLEMKTKREILEKALKNFLSYYNFKQD